MAETLSDMTAQADIEMENADLEEEALKYQCPHCDTAYDDEIFARVHITRSVDTAHLNRDGLMPEEEIHVVSDSEVVDTLSRNVDEQERLNLTLEEVPDEFNDQHKAIILAGAYSPYCNNYSHLTEGNEEDGIRGAHNIMDEHGLDRLSYSTVRRVLRDFYQPQEVEAEKEASEAEDEDEEEQLSDLTEKQQAIVIARLANPDAGTSEIADRAGGRSASYPSQVYDRAEDIIARLDSEIEDGAPVEEVVLGELTEDDLIILREEGLLENLGVDLESAAEELDETDAWDMGVGEQAQAMSASPFDTDTSSVEDEEPAETWGVSDTDTEAESDAVAEVNETAEPTDTARPAGEELEEEPEPETEPEVEAEPEPDVESEATQAVETTSVSEADAVPRDQVESLLDRVQFARKVAEREEPGESNDRQIALAEQLEEEIETLLEAH